MEYSIGYVTGRRAGLGATGVMRLNNLSESRMQLLKGVQSNSSLSPTPRIQSKYFANFTCLIYRCVRLYTCLLPVEVNAGKCVRTTPSTLWSTLTSFSRIFYNRTNNTHR